MADMMKDAYSNKPSELQDMAKRFLHRNHYKLIYQLSPNVENKIKSLVFQSILSAIL